jgi:hypothetical protein
MIIDDFDMRRSSLIPYKADAPLIIDPDRMLPLTIRSKCLKTIAGWDPKISQRPGLIQKAQLSQGNILDVSRQFSAPASGPDQFRFGIGKALDRGRL